MKKLTLFVSVFGIFCVAGAFAELTPTAFPKTIEDIPFTERIENKRLGYEPFKDLEAYHGRNITKPSSSGSQNGNSDDSNGTNTNNNGNSNNNGNNNSENNNNTGAATYYIVQCRTTYPHVRKYMASARNTPVSFGAVLAQDEYLECSDSYHTSINSCFTPCDKSYSGIGKINQELDGVIPPFCAGNGIASEKNAVLLFTNPKDGRTPQQYTKEQVDAVLAKINGYYKECGTNGRRWYWYLFVFESHDNGKTVVSYGDYKTIGK